MTLPVTMPDRDRLDCLAMILERRRRGLLTSVSVTSQESMIEHIEHMRNQVLAAATTAEKDAR